MGNSSIIILIKYYIIKTRYSWRDFNLSWSSSISSKPADNLLTENVSRVRIHVRMFRWTAQKQGFLAEYSDCRWFEDLFELAFNTLVQRLNNNGIVWLLMEYHNVMSI